MSSTLLTQAVAALRAPVLALLSREAPTPVPLLPPNRQPVEGHDPTTLHGVESIAGTVIERRELGQAEGSMALVRGSYQVLLRERIGEGYGDVLRLAEAIAGAWRSDALLLPDGVTRVAVYDVSIGSLRVPPGALWADCPVVAFYEFSAAVA